MSSFGDGWLVDVHVLSMRSYESSRLSHWWHTQHGYSSSTSTCSIAGLGKGRTDYKYNGRCALNRVKRVTPKILQKGSFAAYSKSVTVSYGVWWFLRVGRVRVGDPPRYAGGSMLLRRGLPRGKAIRLWWAIKNHSLVPRIPNWISRVWWNLTYFSLIRPILVQINIYSDHIICQI